MLGKNQGEKKASFDGREVAMLLVVLDLGPGRALLCYESCCRQMSLGTSYQNITCFSKLFSVRL